MTARIRMSGSRWRRSAGFTLLELIVVVALIATVSALATLALPDPNHAALEKEGLRLTAQLEAARAQSRTSGQPLIWRPVEGGYRFEPLDQQGNTAPSLVSGTIASSVVTPWLNQQTSAAPGTPPVLLGPEPVIPAQSIILLRGNQSLRLTTDGLRPFAIVPQSSESSEAS